MSSKRPAITSARDALGCSRSSASRRDGAHAFYLGAELAKAEIALALGKRYVQDEPLDWGVAVPRRRRPATGSGEAGHTLRPERESAMPMIRETIVTTSTPRASRISRRSV